MRLIDADAIKKVDYSGLVHIAPHDYNGISQYFYEQLIHNQPTAYDVDKVVEQLKARKQQLSNDLAKDYYGIREYEHRSDEVDEVIGIVKAGGKE